MSDRNRLSLKYKRNGDSSWKRAVSMSLWRIIPKKFAGNGNLIDAKSSFSIYRNSVCILSKKIPFSDCQMAWISHSPLPKKSFNRSYKSMLYYLWIFNEIKKRKKYILKGKIPNRLLLCISANNSASIAIIIW